MLRSEPMEKVRIVCLESDKRQLISVLHNIGILDLRKSRLDLSDDVPAERFTALTEAKVKLTGALIVLGKPDKKEKEARAEKHMYSDELVPAIIRMDAIDRAYALDKEKKELNRSIAQLSQSESAILELSGIDVDFDALTSEALSFKAYVSPDAKAMAALRGEIASKRLPIELIASGEKGQHSLLLAYESGHDADSLARRHGLREVDIVANRIHGKPSAALRKMRGEKKMAHGRIAEIGRELASLSAAQHGRLQALNEMLDIELMKAKVSETFKRTDRTIIIEGWIPKKESKGLEHAVSKACGDRHYIEEVKDGELAPTFMNRPKMLQPFDYLINFISVPRSDELDPALPFMVSFPIFYGFMISDIGYGVMSFFFAWYLTKITSPEGLVYNVSKIWQLSAVSAIFFGFLSNQWFGLQLNQYFTSFVGFDWFKSLPIILAASIMFGIAQVVTGLAFGFANKYKEHRKVAFGRLFSIFLVVAGSVAIAGGLFHLFDPTTTLASGIIAIGSLVAVVALSGEEAGEVTNLISHPLSYARIMGFGLASVVLAMIIDKALTPTLGNGIVGIAVFSITLIFFLVLHFLNMIVSMFEGAVQGARLNFIEFFTKFYAGGGVRFKPFGSKRVYTEE